MFSGNLIGQCPTSDISLKTQASINAFPSLYPGCDSLMINLRVGWNGGVQTDIVNLDSLIQLKYVDDLFIADTQLTDFDGLDSLIEIDYFILARNLMTDFSGLGNIEYIRAFQIADNDDMINAEGMDKLERIESMSFDGHALLKNFEGLENVKVSTIELQNNPSLESMSGLTSADTLKNLRITNNDMLTDLSGLQNVAKISGDIRLKGNASLTSCSIEALCNHLFESDENIEIINNGAECNSVQEVISNCLGPDDFWLNTQEDVDNFKLSNGCIQEVETLIIGNPFATGNLTSNIKSLDSLECIEHISEHFVVENNDSLPSLDGLNNLTSVGKSFRFIRNKRIKDLLPINQLETVDGPMKFIENDSLLTTSGLENLSEASAIFIQNNDQLIDIDGFTGLVSINGDLFMEGMSVLNLNTGFESLTAIEGDFRIEDCFGITSFSSLENLEYITGQMDLYYLGITNFTGLEKLDSIGGFILEELENLVNMEGLQSLQKVNGDFEIYYCYYELLNLSGLENLEYIAGDFYLEENYMLNDITALNNLQMIGGDDLYIDESESLCFCAIPAICNYVTNPANDIHLEDNLTGCNSIEEVISDCEYCPTCTHIWMNTWLSTAVDSDWHNPNNWSLGSVPNNCQIVILPENSTVSISVSSAHCYKITLEDGSVINASFDFNVGCADE